MTGTLDGGSSERPAFRLIHGDSEAVPAPFTRLTERTHEMPIIVMLSGHLVVDLFKAAVEDQCVNPTRGTSALDRTFAALETAFEAVKADSSEDRPPFVLTTSDEHRAIPTATVQVFIPVVPPDPPRYG